MTDKKQQGASPAGGSKDVDVKWCFMHRKTVVEETVKVPITPEIQQILDKQAEGRKEPPKKKPRIVEDITGDFLPEEVWEGMRQAREEEKIFKIPLSPVTRQLLKDPEVKMIVEYIEVGEEEAVIVIE